MWKWEATRLRVGGRERCYAHRRLGSVGGEAMGSAAREATSPVLIDSLRPRLLQCFDNFMLNLIAGEGLHIGVRSEGPSGWTWHTHKVEVDTALGLAPSLDVPFLPLLGRGCRSSCFARLTSRTRLLEEEYRMWQAASKFTVAWGNAKVRAAKLAEARAESEVRSASKPLWSTESSAMKATL